MSKNSSHTIHPVLYEDSDLIAIHKPEDILSHPNPGMKETRKSAFLGRYDMKERRFDTPGGKIWLIHRLDLDTSGVLLASKNPQTAEKCRLLFEKNLIRKEYLALVEGVPVPESGRWKDHIEKHTSAGQVRSRILPGKEPNAELHYILQSKYKNLYGLIKIHLITGKTHQIRLQAASRHFPVLGDRIYGHFSENKQARNLYGLKRLFLHASTLAFNHPKTSQKVTIQAPLPESLNSVLLSLSH